MGVTPGKLEVTPQVEAWMKAVTAPDPELEEVLTGAPGGVPEVAVVLKRTYAIGPDGRCTLAEDGEQELILSEVVFYDELEAPAVSPVVLDADTVAFRDRTDLVVQGSAYTYAKDVTRTEVALRFGEHERRIRVWGERRTEWGPDGPRFSEPEPFEEMPLRYDRAYGGVDLTRLARHRTVRGLRDLARAVPEMSFDASSPFHYPRNRAGVGYLVDATEESFLAAAVPNLEFPFDPITPERLSVASPEHWLRAPLPACFDWQAPTSFPRVAYLGLAPVPPAYDGPVAEVERGWLAEDFREIPPVFLMDGGSLRGEFTQAAAPGMSFDDVRPGERFELENLHPEQPLFTVELPRELPDVRLDLGAFGFPGSSGLAHLDSHLNSVVIRPTEGEVVVVWCARTKTAAQLPAQGLRELRREVTWIEAPELEHPGDER